MSRANLAYAQTHLAGHNPRELEASALLKAAARLQAVSETASPGSSEYDAALTHNRRLWSIFAGAVSDPASPLPEVMKGQILSLANFIFNQTIRATAEPSAEALKSLIAINRELSAGLRNNG